MRILVACEFSGVVRDAFAARGHDAWSCDLLPSETPGQHIEGDVLAVLDRDWDLLIAHPPCTYLCNSGVRWLYRRGGGRDPARWLLMEKAARFFLALWCAPVPAIAIENPVMHRHALAIIGRRPFQVIQPWQFGHGETKATCLWLKGLMPLRPWEIVAGREGRIWRLPPSADRWKERARTFKGIAEQMALQWGGGGQAKTAAVHSVQLGLV